MLGITHLHDLCSDPFGGELLKPEAEKKDVWAAEANLEAVKRFVSISLYQFKQSNQLYSSEINTVGSLCEFRMV